MAWVKNGLNGSAVNGNAVALQATLSLNPPANSAVFVFACFTGDPGAIGGVGDSFNSPGSSWFLMSQQVGTDSGGRSITFCCWYRLLTNAAGGNIISVSCSTACNIGVVVTCWKPDVTSGPLYGSAGTRTGSGQNSQPVCSPESFTSYPNALAFCFSWDDSNVNNDPTDPTWSLQAGAAAGTPQYGAVLMQNSLLSADGSGSTRWGQVRENWFCQGIQIFYDDAAGPPVVTSNPAISGTPAVGVASGYTPGSASANGGTTPTLSSQRWYVAGVQVGTNTTYLPVAGDLGKALTVQVTWTNNVGSTNATSAAKTVQAAPPAGAWTTGQPGFIEITDPETDYAVSGSFASKPNANSLVVITTGARIATGIVRGAYTVTDNFGDSGGTAWAQVGGSALANVETGAMFWRWVGTGGAGSRVTATLTNQTTIPARAWLAGINYVPVPATTGVELVTGKTYELAGSTSPTAMVNFAGVAAGDFLASWLTASGSQNACAPVSFGLVLSGQTSTPTNNSNGYMSLRNVSAGGSENPNYTVGASISRQLMYAGQWRALPPADVERPNPAWFGYVAGQGGV
jgi:hypothetical protein